MLAVHWSPVKNTRDILHNGIRKSRHGVFCFPLTGQPNLDKWWANAFRQWRPRTQYNGFVFRIVEDDLPAAFSDWLNGAEEKPMLSIAQIQDEFQRAIAFRIGERHFGYMEASVRDDFEIEAVGQRLIAQEPEIYVRTLDSDPGFLEYIFANHQVVLSRSIAARRIMHILPGGSDYGRNIARAKREKAWKNQRRDD